MIGRKYKNEIIHVKYIRYFTWSSLNKPIKIHPSGPGEEVWFHRVSVRFAVSGTVPVRTFT